MRYYYLSACGINRAISGVFSVLRVRSARRQDHGHEGRRRRGAGRLQ